MPCFQRTVNIIACLKSKLVNVPTKAKTIYTFQRWNVAALAYSKFWLELKMIRQIIALIAQVRNINTFRCENI